MMRGMDEKASALPVSKGGAGMMSAEQLAAGNAAIAENRYEDAHAMEPGTRYAPEPFLLSACEVPSSVLSGEVGSREWCRQLAVGRHPGTQHAIKRFAWAHLPVRLQDVSAPFGYLAQTLLTFLPDGPELTTGLRKLGEAKDCAVLAMVDVLDA